jgi:hypothetical protein
MQPPRAGWRGISCFKYFGARQFGRSRRLTKRTVLKTSSEALESSRVKELAPTSSRFLQRISCLEALYLMCGPSKDRARSRLRPALDQRSAWPGRLGRGRRSEISFGIDTLRRSLHPRRVPIRQGADVILIVHIFRIEIAGDSPVAVLGPNLRRLRGADQPEIMFCVLQIVLCGDRIVAGMSVARQLEVLLRHLPRGASYFDVRPI